MTRDQLFLLDPGFEDPAYPGQRFYCWHCALIEGVLAANPDRQQTLDIHRIAWPRPRAPVVSLLGEAHQSLPVLVLADGEKSSHQAGVHETRAFVDDPFAIMAALVERHGFLAPHP